MNAVVPRPETAGVEAVLEQVAAHAGDADAGRCDLRADMALLARHGVLERLLKPCADPRGLVTLLRRIGRASLPVGRLSEGHMNALRLVQIYGSENQWRQAAASARAGTIYGVWGADAARGVTLTPRVGRRVRLAGQKRFCSGLGVVGTAVLTARTDQGTQLVLAETGDARRGDSSGWQVSGMRATASGTYDFDGVEAEALGAPGDYEREPHFQGGVWRYAALQVGGLEALGEAVRAAVADKGEAAGEVQLHRVARIATLAHGARLLVEDAAARVEACAGGRVGAGAGACAGVRAAVSQSLAAREAVEQACLEGIAIVDRALGTRAFAEHGLPDRVRRDLSFFLRQADLDGKLAQVGRSLCAAEHPVGEYWGARC